MIHGPRGQRGNVRQQTRLPDPNHGQLLCRRIQAHVGEPQGRTVLLGVEMDNDMHAFVRAHNQVMDANTRLENHYARQAAQQQAQASHSHVPQCQPYNPMPARPAGQGMAANASTQPQSRPAPPPMPSSAYRATAGSHYTRPYYPQTASPPLQVSQPPAAPVTARPPIWDSEREPTYSGLQAECMQAGMCVGFMGICSVLGGLIYLAFTKITGE